MLTLKLIRWFNGLKEQWWAYVLMIPFLLLLPNSLLLPAGWLLLDLVLTVAYFSGRVALAPVCSLSHHLSESRKDRQSARNTQQYMDSLPKPVQLTRGEKATRLAGQYAQRLEEIRRAQLPEDLKEGMRNKAEYQYMQKLSELE